MDFSPWANTWVKMEIFSFVNSRTSCVKQAKQALASLVASFETLSYN